MVNFDRISHSLIPVDYRAILMSFLSFLSQKAYSREFLRPEVILSISYLIKCRMDCQFQRRILPLYHHPSLQSVVVRRDAPRIMDVRGHSKSAESIVTVQIVRTYIFLELIWLAHECPNLSNRHIYLNKSAANAANLFKQLCPFDIIGHQRVDVLIILIRDFQ